MVGQVVGRLDEGAEGAELVIRTDRPARSLAMLMASLFAAAGAILLWLGATSELATRSS